jgi:hypothetical protein
MLDFGAAHQALELLLELEPDNKAALDQRLLIEKTIDAILEPKRIENDASHSIITPPKDLYADWKRRKGFLQRARYFLLCNYELICIELKSLEKQNMRGLNMKN